MATPFLLLGSLVVAGWGCCPAGAHESTHAPPCASARASHAEDPLLELARGLKSPKVQERKRAIKSLAAIGSSDAWRELFTALGDPESEVGDAAQAILARIAEPAVAGALASRAGLCHRELSIRLRAAEGLGRVGCPVDIALLLGALDDREPEVAHLALWSVERLAHARQLVGDLERGGLLLEHAARSHRDGYVRAAAICARAAVYARFANGKAELALANFQHFLERCREDRDPRVRCAVAIAARRLIPDLAISITRPLGADPKGCVRLALIETFEELACRRGAAALVSALESESLPRARREIVGALQRLSGFKHRDDPRPWRDWLRDLPEEWRATLMPQRLSQEAAGAQAAAPGAGGEGQTTARPSFVGMPLHSERVCFAIDFSGSMWTPMPDGRLPKELVDARLRATLEAMPSSAEFNVVPFTNEVLPWRPKLVPANPGNIRAAIADFEKCQQRGRGNFFDAAVFALDDPDVDTLLTLTDGVPTGGFHSELELVVSLLLERNRFRRVAFDTVLVDAPGASERRFRMLAQESGGRVVATAKAE